MAWRSRYRCLFLRLGATQYVYVCGASGFGLERFFYGRGHELAYWFLA
nr:MAG TPA: hypothetical protein [Caudoviricetes sp.]